MEEQRRRTIVQVGPVSDRFDERIRRDHEVIALWRDADAEARILREAAMVEGMVTTARRGCDAGLMARLPHLKVISNFGVGYDSLDIDEAHRRGIAVSYTPHVLDDCVADLVFGLVIDVLRHITAGDRFVRTGRWTRGAFPLTTRVSGKRLGIVGLGRIGKVVARRASGFDMEIGYHNRRVDPTVTHPWFPTAVDLAHWCDVLVLTCPGGEATRGLIGRKELMALGPHGVLVNSARASVVDEAALIEALEKGTIAGAAIDVFPDEPNVNPAFFSLDTVVLQPHVGSATVETRRAMEDLVLHNLATFFATGRVDTPVPA